MSQTQFQTCKELFTYYKNYEKKLNEDLNKILQKYNAPFKQKKYSEYILKENLFKNFQQCINSDKIIKRLKQCSEKVINKEINKDIINKIKKAKGKEKKNKLIQEEIDNLSKKFDFYLVRVFNLNNNNEYDINNNNNESLFPIFLVEKYDKLIKEKFFTELSKENIDIFDVYIELNEIKIKKLFEDFFVNKNKDYNIYLNKEYFDFVILLNYYYFKENINNINVLYKHFKYLAYIFNLIDIDNYETEKENFELNKLLNNIIKENIEIEENIKEEKLNKILEKIGNDENLILSLILLFTLISNFLLQKDSENNELTIIFYDNIDFYTNSRFKTLFFNALKYFDKFLDVVDLCSYCESILIDDILEYIDNQQFQKLKNIKNNASYNIKQIKQMLTKNIDTFINNNENNNNNNSIYNIDYQKIKQISTEFFSDKILDKQVYDILDKDKSKDLQSTNLECLNKNIKSTNCIILVSGFLSDKDDHTKEWENLLLTSNKDNIIYYYNWPSESKYSVIGNAINNIGNLLIKNIKGEKVKKKDYSLLENPQQVFNISSEKAEICGKLLAYIISSRIFFKYETITLIGFSLGCHVIKNCIKEMYNLYNKFGIKNYDIIEKVIFIAGATSIEDNEINEYINIFNNIVSGDVINCYSTSDQVLNELYTFAQNKNPIGNHVLDFGDEYEKLKNCDFSSLNMGHTEYRNRMDLVMGKINTIC